tara:strand:- start:2263 stop:2529 length:267 start_codon:yes stop_codon:yes gene_type:complete
MNKSILWQRRRIKVDCDGVIVEADVVWWAKDYFVEIISPSKKTIPGKHMMYMIPNKFVFDEREASLTPGPSVPILKECKNMIYNSYKT